MKDGLLLIDKPKGISSRDVVNIVSKKLNTKKIGHTGTLDPLATGLMILCVNKGTKLVELLTNHDKSYLATVKIGIKTDTYDITGNIIKENNNYALSKEQLVETLNSFKGSYLQEVPIYSAIKVKGQKLYTYARNNQTVVLPKRLVTIKEIVLKEFHNDSFTFYVSVSKGTYIRSLINDIGEKLNICMTMSELRRLSSGKFAIENAKKIDEISYDDIVDFKKYLDMPIIKVNDLLKKKVINGAKLDNTYKKEMILFVDENDNNLAIYKVNEKNELCAYKVF